MSTIVVVAGRVYCIASQRWRELCFACRSCVSLRIAIRIICIVYRIVRCVSRYTCAAVCRSGIINHP